MLTLREYGKNIGVEIKTVDGDFYVNLSDYEKLLKELEMLKEINAHSHEHANEQKNKLSNPIFRV